MLEIVTPIEFNCNGKPLAFLAINIIVPNVNYIRLIGFDGEREPVVFQACMN